MSLPATMMIRKLTIFLIGNKKQPIIPELNQKQLLSLLDRISVKFLLFAQHVYLSTM